MTSLTQDNETLETENFLMEMDFDNADPFNNEKSAAEKHLELCANDVKVLYSLAIGLNGANGHAIFDEELFSGTGKLKYKPTEKILRNEVIRRAINESLDGTFSDRKMPQPAKWSKASCTEWLLKYPITKACDVDFVTKAVNELTVLGAASSATARKTSLVHGDSVGNSV